MNRHNKRYGEKFIIAGFALAVLFSYPFTQFLHAGIGTTGAAFLDIPVGGRPAALGASYTALATDAYAPTWNPAGLGFLDSTQVGAQHLAYLDPNHYEYVSFVHPLDRDPNCKTTEFCTSSGIGASLQYFGSGDIPGTDASGTPTGNFSNHYAAYNLAYGRALSEKASWGVTSKWINAQLADVSANAFAADLGGIYKGMQNLTLAATLTNMGTKLTFLNEGDALPMAFHLGAAYQPTNHWNLTAEGVYEMNGQVSGHVGLEWKPMDLISLRAGYRTDTLDGLSALAGLTTGLGLEVWGQELDYAWLPLGALGSTQYLSMIVRFGEAGRERRNLIRYARARTGPNGSSEADWQDLDTQQTIELLEGDTEHVAEENPVTSGAAKGIH